jgi:proline iminopeptidase
MGENKGTSGEKEGYIQGAGGVVWYKVTGGDRAGVPLLTLHGGPGAPHDYLEPLEALSDERPVIFYDQLGCGASGRPDDTSFFTVEYFTEELHRVREALGLARVHILGHSWGAMLAVDYMLTRKPEGVASLVLSGPCLSTGRFIADQRRYLLDLPEDIRKVIEESEASGGFDSPLYQDAMTAYYRRHVCRLDPWPGSMERTMEKFGRAVYEYMWGPSEFTMTGTLKDYDRTEDLKDIKTPVLFTSARYDEATPATVKYFETMLPGSETVIFEDASHMHHMEKPDLYMKAVREFLRRHEG